MDVPANTLLASLFALDLFSDFFLDLFCRRTLSSRYDNREESLVDLEAASIDLLVRLSYPLF